MSGRRILITSALPYANGPIHLGHLVEYIQTDIWSRHQRLAGNEVYYFCADDTHGTPVMLAAQKEGVAPEELVERMHKEHYEDLTDFGVEFTNYYTTNSSENKELSAEIYEKIKAGGHIARKFIQQLFCAHDSMFLPDRYVRGTCPNCKSPDQYGDSCEICSATYSPEELLDSRCSVCGNPPELRESEHLFFQLGQFQDVIERWLSEPGRVDAGIRKKMDEWLSQGLRDWDISRDGPYFGFPIPGETNKYFYVWLDAPVGYMASSKNGFAKLNKPKLFDEFWRADKTEVHHFIGKDIVYFHTLFWPAMLAASGFRLPTAVHVHGFLTVNGEKMSKRRGTLVRARTYLKHLDSQALRYYYASRLTSGLDDLDLSTQDFVQRYNADVVGNLVNIFSRLGSGIAKKLDHTLASGPSEEGRGMHSDLAAIAKEMMGHYESREFHQAMRALGRMGARLNQFVNDAEPWQTIKSNPEAARATITDAFQCGRIIATMMWPVLPRMAEQLRDFLGISAELKYDDIHELLPSGHRIQPYQHVARRLEAKEVEAMFADEREESSGPAKKEKKKMATTEVENTGIIAIDDLSRVELRVAEIKEASTIDGADRLLALAVDVGEEKPRSVIAGIRAAYKPEELVGMRVVAVTNLKPRKMKFGTSEAMLLAAGDGDALTLFVPHRNASPGDRLR